MAFIIGLLGVAVLVGVGEAANNTITAFAAVSFPFALLAGAFSCITPRAKWAIAVAMFAPVVRCLAQRPLVWSAPLPLLSADELARHIPGADGCDLPFFHLNVDFSQDDWSQAALGSMLLVFRQIQPLTLAKRRRPLWLPVVQTPRVLAPSSPFFETVDPGRVPGFCPWRVGVVECR